jgi:hypothetical protein
MATEKQIAANRKNAQKSTGPRTPEGKARSAMNAVKHGLSSHCCRPLPGEDLAEFNAHQEEMLFELDPDGVMESFLAERIIRLSWLLMRASRFTITAMHELYKQTASKSDAKKHPDFHIGRMIVSDFSEARVIERLSKYEHRLETSLFKSMRQLRHFKNQPHPTCTSLRYPATTPPSRRPDTQSEQYSPARPAAYHQPTAQHSSCHAERAVPTADVLSALSINSVNPRESASGILTKQTQLCRPPLDDNAFSDIDLQEPFAAAAFPDVKPIFAPGDSDLSHAHD